MILLTAGHGVRFDPLSHLGIMEGTHSDSFGVEAVNLLAHKRRCYFRCENSRQSILDAWTCLDFICEHAQSRSVCLLCHGSASCVHGARGCPERVHLVKRRKK